MTFVFKLVINFFLGIIKGILFKILSTVVIFYCIASFAYFSIWKTRGVSFVDTSPVEYTISALSQPFVDIFGNGKISRAYNLVSTDKNGNAWSDTIDKTLNLKSELYDTTNIAVFEATPLEPDNIFTIHLCDYEQSCYTYNIEINKNIQFAIDIDKFDPDSVKVGHSIKGLEIQGRVNEIKRATSDNLTNEIFI